MSYWKQSQCKTGRLHKFKVMRQTDEAVEEVCERCHKRVFFRVRKGQLNNYVYLNYHLRSALQPYHPRFNYEYKQHTQR